MNQELRLSTPDPNIAMVTRYANGGIQFVKEIRSSSGEQPNGENETVEVITITRKIGQTINEFPV